MRVIAVGVGVGIDNLFFFDKCSEGGMAVNPQQTLFINMYVYPCVCKELLNIFVVFVYNCIYLY